VRRRAILLSGLKLGVLGFGGGMAVLAMIRRELVTRRKALSEEEFAEAAGVAQMLPGALSVNAFTILGTRLGGWTGGVLAGWGFVFPSFLLMLALAATYPAFRYLPLADSALAGMIAGVIALVVWTAVDLARSGSVRRRCEAALAAATLLAVTLGWVGVLEAVLLAGFAGILCNAPDWRRFPSPALAPWPAALLLGGASLPTLVSLAGVFLRIGAATFGGGYVMIPFIAHEVVEARHWIPGVEFADAVALGQVTPGPVVISAAFIGYRVAGLAGAIAATGMVFLPPGLIAIAAGRALDRFGKNPVVAAFLAGVRPAVVGLLGSAAVALAQAGFHAWSELGLAAAALLAVLRWRVHPLLLLALCAAGHIALNEGVAALVP
jgi:chromate transporter